MNVLTNPQFLKLWGNQILLQVAFNMCNFTALLLIDKLTGSRFAIAQFYAAMTLPAFIVGIFAGSIVDLSNRKKLMLITDAVLSILFIGFAIFSQNFAMLLLIAFFAASASQFFTPAEAATIPLVVKPHQLETANALFLFTALGAVMVGYALAGPLIQFSGGLEGNGAQTTFIVAGILTALGFLLRLSLKTIETLKPEVFDTRIIARTIQLTLELFNHVKNNKYILLPVLLLTLMEFNVGILAVVFIDYVKIYLQLPSTSISYFLILPLVIGLGIGVLGLGKLERVLKRGLLIFIGALGFGLIILVLGLLAKSTLELNTLRALTLVAAFFVGICAVFIAVISRTILQENTPPHMLGRIFSLVTISAAVVTPISVLVITLLTRNLDISSVFVLLGICLSIIALAISKSVIRILH